MTSQSTSERAIADYRQSLILALRMKEVPGDRIGEIVAEVESHVAPTPEKIPPRRSARRRTTQIGSRRIARVHRNGLPCSLRCSAG